MILDSGGVEVLGSVLDATGGTVPFAVVTIRSSMAPHLTTLVQSDSNGEFVAPAPEGQVEVIAQAEAYSQATQRVHAPARGVRLMLAPGAEVVGRVLDAETEEPIAGLSVFARSAQDDLEVGHAVISDREGAFRMVGLSGAVWYEVAAISAAWRSSAAWMRLSVGQQSEPIVLRALRATTLTGTVLLAGEPCRDAQVVASGPVSATAYAGAKGSVRLDGLLPGRYQVLVQCPSALTHQDEVEVADEPVSRVWAVEPGLSIEGRVENARGQPVSAALVSVISVDGGVAKGGVSCVTAANGHFTCSGLSSGIYDCSVVQDRDPNREAARVSLSEGSSEPVLLRTRPSGTIRVSIKWSDAAPRPLTVMARGEAPMPIEAVSDQNGFIFRSIPLGRYGVYLDGAETSQSVDLERDEQVIELEMDVPEYALSIQGQVLDEQGLPIVDAWVSVSRSDLALTSSANNARTLTDEQGNFAVHDLALGTYALHVRTSAGEGEVPAVAAGSSGVVVHVRAQT
jgi:protocatechuate 3,4-dioxygenase beta subunit